VIGDLFRLRNVTILGHFYYLILLKLLHLQAEIYLVRFVDINKSTKQPTVKAITIAIHNVSYILKRTDPLSVEQILANRFTLKGVEKWIAFTP
jgi:hypothetical protein